MKERLAIVSVLLLILIIWLNGCALSDLGGSTPAIEHVYSLEAAKLIAPTIQKANDPSAYNQPSYVVHETQRLLLRFESLSSHTDAIVVDDKNRIKLLVYIADNQSRDSALHSLELCTLSRNWMMFATWNSADPWSGGSWTTPGGDFDASTCLAPLAKALEKKKSNDGEKKDSKLSDTRVETLELVFDLTDWFVNFGRGRLMNYGWILKASTSIQIYGDQSAAYSPRIVFNKYSSPSSVSGATNPSPDQ